MKAVFFQKHGELDVLEYGEIPTPEPKPNQALIKVRAVALNHLDIWVRRGWRGLQLTMPHVSGSDVAGEIVAIKSQHSGLRVGDRVVVNPGILTTDDEWTRRGEDSVSPGYKILGEQIPGGLAEYVCVPVESIFHLPDSISFEDGAAPLLVGVTCWRMLFKRARLQAGESLLVVGAGGGVNALSIMLGRAAGATVFTVTSGKSKVEKALTLGAHTAIDYSTHPEWHAEIVKNTAGRGVDVVVDNVGLDTFAKSLKAVARGGRIVTVGNTTGHQIPLDNRLLFTKQVSLIGSTMGSRQDFIDSTQFLWQRGLRIPIDKVAQLPEGISMISRLESGQQFGKLVLCP